MFARSRDMISSRSVESNGVHDRALLETVFLDRPMSSATTFTGVQGVCVGVFSTLFPPLSCTCIPHTFPCVCSCVIVLS